MRFDPVLEELIVARSRRAKKMCVGAEDVCRCNVYELSGDVQMNCFTDAIARDGKPRQSKSRRLIVGSIFQCRVLRISFREDGGIRRFLRWTTPIFTNRLFGK
jgi:hypothetical protein